MNASNSFLLGTCALSVFHSRVNKIQLNLNTVDLIGKFRLILRADRLYVLYILFTYFSVTNGTAPTMLLA